MRRLLVTTASVIALGLGTAGLASAQQSNQATLSGSSTPATASTQTKTPHKMAMSTHRTMRMSSTDIRQAQTQLRTDHLYQGRIDGRIGPATRTAIRRFQQQNHLPVTARLDSRTMSSLSGGTMGQGSSQQQPSGNSLQNGSQPSNTMGQGSSAQPTPMTPPTGTPNDNGGTTGTPNTNGGTQTNPNSQTNQKQ
jgi:peptidoglycan hydrolase-like protein with peptidoglycan-binding domain